MQSIGTIVTGTPDSNTTCAACGSTQMLNSAAGVALPPSKNPPPINTTSRMRGTIFGSMIMAIARLVIGPSVQTVISPSRRSHQRVDEEIDRVAVLQRRGRLRQGCAVEAGLAMDIFRGLQRFTIGRGQPA